MSCQEQQEEEVEVLQSIYEGDDCFQGVNATTYQYKLGEDGSPHSFVLEVVWGENYPEEVPTINMDCFYNKHMVIQVWTIVPLKALPKQRLPTIKDEIAQKVKEEAEQNLGCAMTYTLFEWVKENAESLIADQPLAPVQVVEEAAPKETQVKAVKVKKEQLTKAQKRKITNQTNIRGERQRGWDWVDVIRHLSQTGKYTGDDT